MPVRVIQQELKKCESRLLVLENEKAKADEFVYMASHQLRDPLTAIKWTTESFLQTPKLTREDKDYIDQIYTSTVQLSNLIDVLLNLSRLERRKLVILPKTFELVVFIRNILKGFESWHTKKGLSLVFNKYPPKLEATTDSAALHSIIQVIISNAIEYTPKGGKIEIVLNKKAKTFLLQISDTGIGISQKEQKRIFNKYVRGSNAKEVKHGGLGLGLYIAKQLTRLLGGKIWFESRENKGTTFYIELPLILKARY